jgi:2-(1,2-epoxy-1,2-dihydrophenyl)acetyl-CoA isomerase
MAPRDTLDTLEVALDAGLLTVALRRPAVMNAVNGRMADELGGVLDRAATDPAVRCVLITGHGKAFCAGRDLSEAKPGEDAHEIITTVFNPLLRKVRDVPVPTIAAVNGAAMGVGLGIALNCDIVLAADNAKFSSPFPALGVALDSGGHYHLPRLVGTHRALEMIFTGTVVRGPQAEAWGLVNRSVAGSKLLATATALGARIAAGPTTAFRRQKELVRRSERLTWDEVVEAEARIQADLVTTTDYAEGLAAFREKRAPQFTGA